MAGCLVAWKAALKVVSSEQHLVGSWECSLVAQKANCWVACLVVTMVAWKAGKWAARKAACSVANWAACSVESKADWMGHWMAVTKAEPWAAWKVVWMACH